MKIKNTMAGTVASLAFTASAHGQSSVTMYGIVDAGLSVVTSNAGNQFAVESGALHGDRWGLKSTEALGGGLKAVFQIENGFSVASGQLKQGGREFGRQAYVGLESDSMGTVTLGRQYDPNVDLVQGATADRLFGGTFGTPGDIDNYDNTMRINSSVKYLSPNIAGFSIEAIYGFSGLAGQAGEGQSWGVGARYASGPSTLAAAYFYSSNASATGARTTWASPTSDSLFNTAINDGYQTAHAMGIARAAGSYVLGAVTLGVSYSNIQLKRDAQSTFESNEHYNAVNGIVSYRLTRAAALGVGYTYTKAGGDTSATYHQANVGLVYDLSTRTSLYALAAYQLASGYQRAANGALRQAEASIGSYGVNGGRVQELAILGMLHRF